MAHKALASIGSVIIAETAPYINQVAELHIPPVVMELFQCLAWSAAFIIAMVTLLRYIKDKRAPKEDIPNE